MKKTFKLAALSVLSLLLVGCQKTGGEPQPGSSQPGSSQPSEETKALSLTIKNKDDQGKKQIYLEIGTDGTFGSTKVEVEVLNSKTDNGYTLSIADDSIASLSDDGTVTALWGGKTTITATSKEDPSVKDTIDVQIWDNRNVAQRWQEKLAGDIKLEGKLIEIDTIKDKEEKTSTESGWTGFSTVSEYSNGKYHNELNRTYSDGSTDSLINMTIKKLTAEDIPQYAGYYADYAVTESNKVGINNIGYPAEKFTNPFIALKGNYEVNESEDDVESFTLSKSASETAADLQKSLNIWVESYGGIFKIFGIKNVNYEAVNFYEVNKELSIEFTTNVITDNEVQDDGTTLVSHQFVLAYDVTVDAGEASDLQPFEQTEDTLKLQAKLDELTKAQQYKISRSSQPVTYTVDQKSGKPTYTNTDASATTWDALYKGDQLYVERNNNNRSGILVDSDGKHRYYTYDEGNYKDVHRPLETINGYKDDTGAVVKDKEWEKVRPSFFPQYDKVSAAVFDAKENNTDNSIDFTVKRNVYLTSLQMSEFAETNAAFCLGADNTDKVATSDNANNSLVIDGSLHFNLSASGDLTLSYLLKSDESNATLETYTYDLKSEVTIPTYTEKAPSNLVGEWELTADASVTDDDWKSNGLTLEVKRGDPNATPAEEDTITKLELKKGATEVNVKDISVSGKIISFKLSNDDTECSLQMREGRAILTIGGKEYSLVQKGTSAKITEAKATINGIDLSKFDTTESAVGAKDSKKDQADALKTQALEDVDKCSTIQGVNDVISKLNEELVKIALAQVNEQLDKFMEPYDDLNGLNTTQGAQSTSDFSDKFLLYYLIHSNQTFAAALSAAKTPADVFAAYDALMKTVVANSQSGGITLEDYASKVLQTIAQKVTSLSASVAVDPNATDEEKATLQAAKDKADAVLNNASATDHDKLAAIYEFNKARDKVLLKYKQEAINQLVALADGYDQTNGSDAAPSDYAIVMNYIQNNIQYAVQLIDGQTTIAGINNAARQLITLFGNTFMKNGIYTIAQKQQLITQYQSSVAAIDSTKYTGKTGEATDKDTIDAAKTALDTALTDAGENLDAQIAAYQTALVAINAVVNRIPRSFVGEFTATKTTDSSSTKDVVIDGYKIKIGDEDVVNLTITTTGEGDAAVTVITFDTADGKHWKLEVATGGGLTLTEVGENGDAKADGEVYNLVKKQAPTVPTDPTVPDTDSDAGSSSINFHFADLQLA